MVNITESITVIMENKMEKDKENKGKTTLPKVLLILFSVLFLACVVWLVYYFVSLSNAEKQMDELKDNYIEENLAEVENEEKPEVAADIAENDTTETGITEETSNPLEGYDVPEKQIDFPALKQETNEHIYAWITVPGTAIDYPVLQHPEVFGYYLDHNLDHSTGYPGCIYSQLYNSKEWDDPITVLYGHNMKNGTMFAGLHQYRDSQFFEENPYIYIYTEDRILVYQIFAAYEYSDLDLVQLYLMGGENAYKEYLSGIYNLDGMNNNFNTEIQVSVEDKVLTLATCISNKPTNRYLVQGILVAEGTQE